MARMNGFAGELSQRPISMPHFNLAPLDDSEERKELARKLAEARTVRAGAEAWAQMARAQSFTAWVAVGRRSASASSIVCTPQVPAIRETGVIASHFPNG